MIIIGSRTSRRVTATNVAPCPKCRGSMSAVEVTTYFTVYCIPICPCSKTTFLVCPICAFHISRAAYEQVTKRVYRDDAAPLVAQCVTTDVHQSSSPPVATATLCCSSCTAAMDPNWKYCPACGINPTSSNDAAAAAAAAAVV
jgi:hypothetical protein